MFNVTVITPSIPSRAKYLAENIESVNNQTVPVRAHLISIDYHKMGPARLRNQLVKAVMSEWICFLDDDDLFMPNHIERLAQEAHRDVEVIYSWPWMHSSDSGVWMDSLYRPQEIMLRNAIPVTAFIRTTAFNHVGGMPENERFEDWGLWKRLHLAGANFFGIEEPTWVYRFLDEEARNVRE